MLQKEKESSLILPTGTILFTDLKTLIRKDGHYQKLELLIYYFLI